MVPAVAVNVFVVAPAGTVMEAGTVNMALLLDKLTLAPPVRAAPDNVTVQVDVPPLPRLVGAQASELTVAGGVRETVACWELLL